MKEFQDVITPKGLGVFIMYDNLECTMCTVDINGMWYHFNIDDLTSDVVDQSEQLCPQCSSDDLFDIDDHYTKCQDCGFSFVGA